jgi:hypothetical protein
MRACPAGLPVKAHALCALPGFPTSGFGRRSERHIGRRWSYPATPSNTGAWMTAVHLPNEDLPLAVAVGPIALDDAPTGGSQQTAKRAIAILLKRNEGFHAPTRKERDALLVAFAMRRKVLYGAAFDIVRSSEPIDWADPSDIARKMDALIVYEIKSSNRPSIGPDLKDYFFNLSTAELLVAQSLGSQFRFAFVNVVTGDYTEMALRDVFARARGIYPAWSIKF